MVTKEDFKKQVATVDEVLRETIKSCPALKDIVVVLNWDGDAVPRPSDEDDYTVPASMIYSNRKNASKAHLQAVELSQLLTSASQSITERLITALVQAYGEVEKEHEGPHLLEK